MALATSFDHFRGKVSKINFELSFTVGMMSNYASPSTAEVSRYTSSCIFVNFVKTMLFLLAECKQALKECMKEKETLDDLSMLLGDFENWYNNFSNLFISFKMDHPDSTCKWLQHFEINEAIICRFSKFIERVIDQNQLFISTT